MAKRSGTFPNLFFWAFLLHLPAFIGTTAYAQPKTSLEPKTLKAYEKFVLEFEKGIRAMTSGSKPFLWIESQASDKQDSVRRGEILIFKGHKNVDIPKGMIHVWGVSFFVPGATAEDATKLLLDYNRHKDVYPSVIDSKLLGKEGDTVRGSLKFKHKKVLTVVLNTEHQAELTRLDKGRYFIRVHSTRIAEVADSGHPEEHELPVGKDSGFMWRLRTYWFLEPQPGGVSIECQSLTLTRSIPTGLGWLIKPFVESIPRDSLMELAEGTQKALRK